MYEFWFVVGSQLLYGEETLKQVANNSAKIVEALNASGNLPYKLVYKDTVKTADGVTTLIKEANYSDDCAGIMTFCHTFSPSKMWINGLSLLQKPYCHFHTQFNLEIPNEEIDMDYMNLHQSAHGDREHGFIGTRMRLQRKVIAGHWSDSGVQKRIGKWQKAAIGAAVSKSMKVMRFGDNMREVAVTEGDKVEAQIKFGWQVDAWPVTELADAVAAVSGADTDALVEEYYSRYEIILDGRDPREFREHVAAQAQIELGFERFLKEKDYHAIVTHFDDLGTLKQLPGLAIQRLMEKGYGFGAEGDWKTAAMVRLMKLMAADVPNAKGTSMLEDYTYNLVPGKEGILQAHMLEICPSLAAEKPAIRCKPLSMGRREDPARLVFTSKTGPGVAVSLIDLGTRFRLIIAEVDCKANEKPMPQLPVATVFWTPKPDFTTGVEAWILSGGAHHTAFSYDLTSGQMSDWAEHMGIEALVIGKDTTLRGLKQEMMLGQAFFR